MRCLRRILGITWQDKITNTEVLAKAGLPSMFTLLRQRRLRWLGHVRRMEDGRIPKDILYGQLASGKRRTGRPQLRYSDACKRDMKALDINVRDWEDLAADRPKWRATLTTNLKLGEMRMSAAAEEKRARRKERQPSTSTDNATHRCDTCGKICGSRNGLFSHAKRCSRL